MKQFIQSKGLAFSIMLLTSSCVTQHFMYAPTAVSTPALTRKNESAAGLVVSRFGFDAEGGYALSDRVAIQGSWYRRRETNYDKGFLKWGNHDGGLHWDSILYKRRMVNLGLTYFQAPGTQKNLFYSVTAGYGIGRFFMEENAKTPRGMPGSDSLIITNHYFKYDARASRFFFQPALIIPTEDKAKIIFSVRWTGTLYTHVQGTPDHDKYGHVSNKLLSYIDPAFTAKIYLKDWWYFIFQAGASINTRAIDYDYRAIIGNIGLEIDPVKLFSKKAGTGN